LPEGLDQVCAFGRGVSIEVPDPRDVGWSLCLSESGATRRPRARVTRSPIVLSIISVPLSHIRYVVQPNGGGEPHPIAGATEERTLSGVGSTAWFGDDVPQTRMRQRA
jgi:hypothetical protein